MKPIEPCLQASRAIVESIRDFGEQVDRSRPVTLLMDKRSLSRCTPSPGPLPGDAARLELRWSLRDDRLYRRILRVHALIAALPIHDASRANIP